MLWCLAVITYSFTIPSGQGLMTKITGVVTEKDAERVR